ncbi:DUF982 domain-containing protein [Agrobacterium rosae]|uniref:DUF982 domain-containing protein n=1 Tax=Agrobacterium rosae TaxID=1972867 RepID=UPI00203389E6|nr:DUF982 domain-containing protein [Agrobacterium rosae]MCM2432119.1 DUF982 domain-containing protein [Agrobacterium rosae]
MAVGTSHPIVPLTIEWGGFETFTTVEGLARCLLGQWPADCNADAYVTALMVCDAVLSGSDEDTPEDARASFVDAAHEAGMSIFFPDDGFI